MAMMRILPLAAIVGSVVCGATSALASAQFDAPCRTVETTVDGQQISQVFCRDADGQWRQPPSGQVAVSGLPHDFRGRINYSGTYEGSATIPSRRSRRIDLGTIAEAALGGDRRQVAGNYTVDVEFNGNAVTGTYRGSGGLDTTTFTGTRAGERCRLFNNRSGASIEVVCSRSRFAGTIRSASGERQSYQFRVEANATRFVDAVEEERQRVAAAALAAQERQRLAAERARLEQAEAARVAALPRPRINQQNSPGGSPNQARREGGANALPSCMRLIRQPELRQEENLSGSILHGTMTREWIPGEILNECGRTVIVEQQTDNGWRTITVPRYASLQFGQFHGSGRYRFVRFD